MRDRASLRAGLLGGLIAAIVMMGLPVVASVGSAIIHGEKNYGSAETELQGSVTGPLLRLDNNAVTGVGARFETTPGNAPFSVSSNTKVRYLNADRLDNKSVQAFMMKDDYDADEDGVVDSGEVKIRHEEAYFEVDLGAAIADRIQCATPPVRLDSTTTVVVNGGLTLRPLDTTTSPVFGQIYYRSTTSSLWSMMDEFGMEATPPGKYDYVSMPLNSVKEVGAGNWVFGVRPWGPDLLTGDDYTGYCELTATVYIGQGASTDVVGALTAPTSDHSQSDE